MLHELAIENLGVIEAARVSLGPGLTCVTGETGAGKTMVLTGLGLILGAKADAGTVRAGADEAVAEAVLDVPDAAAGLAADAGASIDDDGTIVVARTVGATTRSRATLGGRTVPQALLAELAESAVTVHGQADQVRLRTSAKQRATLDEFAGAAHLAVLAEYRAAWSALADARAALAEMETGASIQRAHIAALRADLEAIDAVDPQSGEDDDLSSRIAVLENSAEVRAAAGAAQGILAGDDEVTAVAVLDAAARALTGAGRHEPALADLATRIAELRYGAADLATELARYLDSLDADGASLDELHSRRSAIAGLKRRLGTDLEGVLDHAARAREAVAADDAWDETVAARRAHVDASEARVAEIAARVSAGRTAAAAALAEAVAAELSQLAMADARFGVTVEPTQPGPSGADSVAMTLAAHPGATARAVADAASGGELSRIMLAIEVALAARAAAPGHTFIFDEVDAGVGGKAALAVGQRLAELARTHQVIVVTHLAQVAAFADAHVVVEKATEGLVTRSQVHQVAGEDRIAEIARLLSGQEESSTARAHAVELLEASAMGR
ncbi:DNA repair protein RecN [Demequina sp.]|uniref:DNA repair protein RecN n=1 Tax=Demequina sp. TaxID=2050685 RepID=UPI003D11564A